MQIIPSVLVATFAEFERQVHRLEAFFPYIQIDVMDGKFVAATSFQDIERVNTLETTLQFEVHLMVENPVEEMRKWRTVESVFRVLFPVETESVERSISFAKKEGWEIGLVLNPETPLSAAEKYFPSVDVVQFMTVHPGRQGSPFIPEVKEKIKAFIALSKRPLCAVDGAVNKTTICGLKDAGVDIVYPGSAFMQAEDVGKAYQELKAALV
ncbi:MAG: hypothetical protein HY983_01675 [Candidatus Magasanikbacteria bacterium]|nr:hypothetical protein [Candidatus Magasanikbacteria bacterium]